MQEPEPAIRSTSSQTTQLDVATLLEEKAALLEQVICLKTTCDKLSATCDQLRDENALAMEELVKAEKLKRCAVDEASFKDDDNKVRFYTGLPSWSILHTLFTFVEPCLSTHTSLSSFQKLLLTLMRLRLSLSGEDLGYHFGIHQSTVSRVFANTLDVLYAKLKCLIIWPDREVLRRTLPMDFRKYSPKCVVIIDCFEIFIERPSDLKA